MKYVAKRESCVKALSTWLKENNIRPCYISETEKTLKDTQRIHEDLQESW